MDELRDARLAAARSSASPATIMKYLKVLRAYHTTTNPLEVYRLTSKVLHPNVSRGLSESDIWSVREDHAIACTQLGKREEALTIVNLVAQRFPRSCRASRLKGMYLESIHSNEEALATYEAALQIDPDNLMIIHRVTALKTGLGELSGSLADLHTHLTTHLGDYQAWYEAGKLHSRRGAYAKALFCFEEVLMHQPGDLQLILTVADCLYACAGVDNIRTANKYYAAVVELSGGSSVKALLGVCQCVARLGEDVEAAALGKLAADTLVAEYVVKDSRWAGALAACLRG